MLLWLWHSAFDGIGDTLQAAISPKPRSARKISSYRGANAVSTMASGARRPANLSMKDFLPEGDLLARRSREGCQQHRQRSIERVLSHAGLPDIHNVGSC